MDDENVRLIIWRFLDTQEKYNFSTVSKNVIDDMHWKKCIPSHDKLIKAGSWRQMHSLVMRQYNVCGLCHLHLSCRQFMNVCEECVQEYAASVTENGITCLLM